ncbi:glycosyltransferase [Streptomyces sp. Wb2n-11]|uniref:glycosyltransferase n=1 Tax=Streptomyces sp. Wb2n-11 TaxID=1030533 RepID=UPI000B157A7D|nr:glycosyltransferase [Streptomyces sp. Wb2n-11]
MKALHIITGLGVGGAEQQLRLLLRHLPVRCDVVTLTNPGAVADGLRADGVRVTHLGMRGNRDLKAVPALVRLIRRGKYDLVHTHLYRACVYGRVAARLAGVTATVATEHSLGHAEIEGRPLTPGARALYLGTERLGSATVAVSATVAGRLRDWGVPAARIHVVPNGIDAARFRFDSARRLATRARLGVPADAFVVGGVGRLVPGKRFDVLVRAVAALPGAWLLLAGDGPDADALRTLASRLGAADRIRLLGECDALTADGPAPGPAAPAAATCAGGVLTAEAAPHSAGAPRPASRTTASRPAGTPSAARRPRVSRGGAAPGIPELLCAMDTFVSVSREEAFGLAVVEALAAGLPVLHSTCPAIDDLPAGQSPGARRISGDAGELTAALRRQMQGTRRRLPPPPAVGHYDIARSSTRLMDVYAHALTLPPSSPSSTKRARQ